MSTTPFTTLKLIKASALNKGRARTWLEHPAADMAAYGFGDGMRVDIVFNDDAITVTANSEGKRKPTIRAGKFILDMCEPVADRDARWGGALKLRVDIAYGVIVIRRGI